MDERRDGLKPIFERWGHGVKLGIYPGHWPIEAFPEAYGVRREDGHTIVEWQAIPVPGSTWLVEEGNRVFEVTVYAGWFTKNEFSRSRRIKVYEDGNGGWVTHVWRNPRGD